MGRWLGGVVAWFAFSGVAGADPLDKPAFTATPAELLAAAKAVPASDADVVALRVDDHTSVDDRGRATSRWRMVFVVRSTAGAADWGVLSGRWNASYQDRPAIRARVIDPRGRATELDPARVTDEAIVHDGPQATSEGRSFEARLPPLEVGSVVEEEAVTVDRELRLPAGDSVQSYVGYTIPTHSTRISFSVPPARKARVVERQLPKGVVKQHATAGGRETWTYAFGALPAVVAEGAWPGDAIAQPYVGLTTAPSWTAIARDYRAIVDQRIAAGPVSLPADVARTPTAIVAWLERTVKYSGITWRVGAAVPATPAETAKRGIGGVADRAVLLVALLRQAGLRADLALLLDGPGTDVDPDLPGIGAFGHALVRVRAGAADTWIDPLDDLWRPGQLHAFAQGRRALVIADDTAALVTTPAATARDNTYREVRTFALAEQGPARVTEVSRTTGVFEAEERVWIRDSRQLHQDLGTYVERTYRGTEDRLTTTRPDDLATPFEVTLAVAGVRTAWSERNQIEVFLNPNDVLQKLPELAKQAGPGPRRGDFVWSIPHVVEIEHRLVVPVGFTLTLLAERSWPVGPASLTQRNRVDGRTVIVTLRFDSGKPRLTPAELGELRAGIAALKDETVAIAFEQTGLALAHAGKPREAIAELEQLVRAHPREALHHDQLAEAYIWVGAGEAARRAARKAIDLEPKNADAHSMLGWVLRHDTLGRDFGFDHDRAGALRAYELARRLNPKHVGAAADHAQLLERDAHGVPYRSGADLRGAVSAWRAAYELDADHGLPLARALFWAGDHAEAETVARKLAASEDRDALVIAATAAVRGVPAATAAAKALASGDRYAKVLVAARVLLIQGRRYDEAKALDPTMGAPLKIARRASPQADADPVTAVIDATLTMVDPHHPPRSLWDDQLRRELDTSALRAAMSPIRAVGFSSDVIADMFAAMMTTSVDGTPAAWRVTTTFAGKASTTYVALDRGIAKLVGTPETPRAIGRHVLRLLAQRDEASARKLLDWIRGDLAPSIGKQPVATTLGGVWGPGLPSGTEAISLAGAMLAGSSDAGRTIPILERCNSTATDARKLCDHVLAWVYFDRRRWSELERLTAAVQMRAPDLAAELAVPRAAALMCLRRFDEADRELDARLAKRPADEAALATRIEVAGGRGASDDVIRRADALFAASQSAFASNQAAWARLAYGVDLAGAVAPAKVAAAAGSAGGLHTLASVEAELGDLAAAKSDLDRAIDARTLAAPEPSDWYVAGRIAEQLGLKDDAIARYRRANVATSGANLVPDSDELARRRLAALGGRR